MKVRVTREIPVAEEFQPKVGSIHDVIREAPGQYGLTVFIMVSGEEVGLLCGEYESIPTTAEDLPEQGEGHEKY